MIVSVYDLGGRKIYQCDFIEQTTLPVFKWGKGMCTVQLNTDNKSVMEKLVVK